MDRFVRRLSKVRVPFDPTFSSKLVVCLHRVQTLPAAGNKTVKIGLVDLDIVTVTNAVSGGGFFHACEDLRECSIVHPLSALFFFFFEMEISSRTLIPLFMPESVPVAQRAETTVAEFSMTSCV